jgi:hypothetical protein
LQEKLDSLEKRKAVDMPTNEVSQPQLEVQSMATNISSDGYKLFSGQVELRTSETQTMECMTTQKEDEKALESFSEVDNAVKLDLPQSSTNFYSIKEKTGER